MAFSFKPATPAPAFGGFGASTATPSFGASQPASTSAPSFGFNAPAPATNSFNFGTPAPAASTAAPSFSFGTTQAPTSAAPLFGSAPAPASNAFGAPAAGGFSFGAPAQPAATSAPSFSFGAASTTANAPPTNLFGASQPANNTFGASQPANNTFGASTLGQSQQPAFGMASTSAQPAEPTMQDKLMAVHAAWNSSSPACRFQAFFYNVVEPPHQVSQFGKPPLANDAAWQRARRENPDPDRMVPALAMGFDDVKKRVEAQEQRAKAHYGKLQEISAEITKRTTTQVEPSSTRLQRAALNQTKLAARLMAVIAQLHPLTTHRGAPLRADEEALFNRIAAAQTEFANGPTRLPAMLNELWVQVASRRAAMQAQSGEKEGKEWEVANEEELGKILEVVDQQQRGLAFLTKTLQGDLADINLVREGFGLQRV